MELEESLCILELVVANQDGISQLATRVGWGSTAHTHACLIYEELSMSAAFFTQQMCLMDCKLYMTVVIGDVCVIREY